MDFDEFYADRVKNIENEWSIFKEYVQIITPNANEIHELEWAQRMEEQHSKDVELEGEQIDEEIKRLNAAVSKALIEVQNMKASKSSRIQQIARLSELSHPVQQDVAYLIPEKFSKHSTNSAVPVAASSSKKLSSLNTPYKPIKTGDVLRLEKRVETETTKTSDYMQQLMISLRETEEERYKYRAVNSKKDERRIEAAKALYEEVDRSEHQSFMAVTELLKLRFRIIVAQRQEVEELEKLHTDKNFYLAKEERVRDELLSDLSLMERRMKKELQEAKRDFQKQLMTLDLKLREMESKEEQALKVHPVDENFDEKVEAALAAAKSRYRKLKRRYALEMEGYHNEAAQLRTTLSQIEKVYNVHAAQWKQRMQHRNGRELALAAASATADGSGDDGGIEGAALAAVAEDAMNLGNTAYFPHEDDFAVTDRLPSIAEEQVEDEYLLMEHHIGQNGVTPHVDISNAISSITPASQTTTSQASLHDLHPKQQRHQQQQKSARRTLTADKSVARSSKPQSKIISVQVNRK